MNLKSFRKIAPKRLGLMAAGLGLSFGIPAAVYKLQGKDWKTEFKDQALTIGAAPLAGAATYGAWKFRKLDKTGALRKLLSRFRKKPERQVRFKGV